MKTAICSAALVLSVLLTSCGSKEKKDNYDYTIKDAPATTPANGVPATNTVPVQPGISTATPPPPVVQTVTPQPQNVAIKPTAQSAGNTALNPVIVVKLPLAPR
jgi:cell division septation protein DedD